MAGYTVVSLGFVIVLAAIAVSRRRSGPGMILLVGPIGAVGSWRCFMWYTQQT